MMINIILYLCKCFLIMLILIIFAGILILTTYFFVMIITKIIMKGEDNENR